MTEAELRMKCESLAPAGDALSRAVLVLFASRDRVGEMFRTQLADAMQQRDEARTEMVRLRLALENMAERVAAQSELLARRA